jgi:hypothetical protein
VDDLVIAVRAHQCNSRRHENRLPRQLKSFQLQPEVSNEAFLAEAGEGLSLFSLFQVFTLRVCGLRKYISNSYSHERYFCHI